MVGEYMEFTQKNGYFNYKRNEQAKYWMYESINDTLRETFYHNPAVEKMLNFTATSMGTLSKYTKRSQ